MAEPLRFDWLRRVQMWPLIICVNAVSAGVVATDALQHFPNREQRMQPLLEKTSSGRLITPRDVANVVVFLYDDMAKQIFGKTLVVDGGYSIFE